MLLEGLEVVDLSRLLPGPYATRVLAELGARVVKIEPLPGGDYARWWPPLVGDPPTSSYFRELNRGKRSVALDLRDPHAQAALARLVARADVLVDSFRPGTLAKLGLDPARFAETHPRLVYCALSGFGLDGPHADRAGHDVGYLARAGGLAVSGSREAPTVLGVQVADLGGALTAVSGILAALLRRERTGRGAIVDTALLEAALPFNVLNLAAAQADIPVTRGAELLDGSRPAYAVYPTRDGKFLAVGTLEPKFWRRFVEAIGLPDLVDDGLDLDARGDAVRAQVRAKLLERDRDAWMALLEPLDCCVEPVLEPREALHDPQLRARGVVDPSGFVRSPIRVTPTLGAPPLSAATLSPAPALGADTRAELEALGYTGDALEQLLAPLGG